MKAIIVSNAINNLIPTLPEKAMPDWAPEYLSAVDKARGTLTRAAKMIGKSYSTTYKARRKYPEFERAIENLKAEWDSRNLEDLEELLVERALKPGNVTERIFLTKALAPHKYRDKHVEKKVGNITIVYGFRVGGARKQDGLDPAMSVQRNPDDEKQSQVHIRHLVNDVLSDEEIDIDL